ncbi:hypothetical protein KEM56_000361 [Ascosphaera pollenicola]|nr:hypothetical protein KEM56_000361 [Ascosphaera pollenicola]
MFPKYFGLRGNSLNLAISFIAGLDFFLFGYDQGVTGGLLDMPSFVKHFEPINRTKTYLAQWPDDVRQAEDSHRATVQGITVASYNLGCFCGAVFTIFLGNYFGRKKTIFIGSFIMTVGAILQCTAFSLPHLIVGRLVTGWGNGMNTSTVPMWQSETAAAHERGKLVMIEGMLVTGGITLSYWIDYGFIWIQEKEVAWRFPLAFQIVFALVIFGTIMNLPESPRWLIMKNRPEEALDVLSAIADLPPDDPYIVTEFQNVEATVEEMSQGSFRSLFVMSEYREFHRVVLAYVCQMYQQICGINLITYYTAGQAVSMAVLAGTNYRMTHLGDTHAGVGQAVFLFVFNTFFGIGWLSTAWLYPAEIVPLKIRAPTNALSTSANWIFNFMVVMICPVAFANIGYQTYIIFAVINAFIFPTIYLFFPETRRRSLEEMDDIFKKSSNIFDVVKVAANEPFRYDEHGRLKPEFFNVGAQRKASLQSGVGEAHHIANADIEDGLNEKLPAYKPSASHHE